MQNAHYGSIAQGQALLSDRPSNKRRQPNFAIGLPDNSQEGTILPAPAKSVAEIGVSNLKLEPTHALAWFFVGTRTSFLGAHLPVTPTSSGLPPEDWRLSVAVTNC